nr:MAG TPA: hypothetical protein [Caudoviricetes sp.]
MAIRKHLPSGIWKKQSHLLRWMTSKKTPEPRCTRTVVFLCPFLRKGFKEDDMELKDTVKGMMSDDYKERMAAEYHQTKIRYEKLKKLNTRMEAKVICTSSAVEPQMDGTPARLLRDQQRIMGEYLHILELRAEIEEIFI